MAEAAPIVEEVLDEPEVFVGKDVLELLSSSMYVNPLSIFREYVQNATDAIDEAVASGLLASNNQGLIEINLDHIDRRVVIRDNGKGLSNKDFPTRMLSFGASEKRGTDARGFRGVGRLSGLGYVQQLVFRSRAQGDTKVLEATWDGRVVKRMLANHDSDADLRTIVREAVTLKRLEPEDYPTHFFEVELVKPRRIANDRLLNELEIEAFVSQVCPCPFSPAFSYGEEIAALLDVHGRAGKAYQIHINGAEEPVYRPYRDHVEYSDTKRASLRSLKTFEIESIDGEPAAVGWLVHHDYQGAIPAAQGVRGLRARVGNIQVGHDRLFLEVFPEDRFCSWTIGEVHVLDGRVVPNGRRDEFESNTHLDNIIAHLRPVGAEVARECRVSSQKRNRIKAFELAADKVYEKLDVLKQGAVSERLAKSLKAEIGTLLSEMRKAIEFDLFEDEEQRALRGRLSTIEKTVDAHATKVEGDILDSVPEKKRDTYKEVFDLIYDCSVNQVAAKSLIDRMLDRLSRS
ncbi:ATP-binding protein [Rhodobacteraceae bacterium NNCM2]|nr:ATP-binding protein [Coraliihabitans acroporae]